MRLLTESATLRAAVATTREALIRRTGLGPEQVPDRPVASLLSLALFARLVSPVLGATVLTGVTPKLGLDDVGWTQEDGRLLLTLLTDPPAGDAADLLDVLAPLVAAFDVSAKVLWGNVSSALAAAAGQIGPAARPLVDDLLATAPLAGTGDWTPAFRRHSCCLYYQLPGGGYCGDCVLLTRSG